MAFHVPNDFRVRHGRLGSDDNIGNNGLFMIPMPVGSSLLMRVIASDGFGWEHVSASFVDHCPTWEEMCHVKSVFWDPEDCVVQFHPPQSEYVNCHPFCLHLWRPIGVELPRPNPIQVGVRR